MTHNNKHIHIPYQSFQITKFKCTHPPQDVHKPRERAEDEAREEQAQAPPACVCVRERERERVCVCVLVGRVGV